MTINGTRRTDATLNASVSEDLLKISGSTVIVGDAEFATTEQVIECTQNALNDVLYR